MAIPPLLLVAAGLAVGLIVPIRDGIEAAAAATADRAAYTAHLLGGDIAVAAPPPHPGFETLDFVLAGVTVLGALVVAAGALREPMSGRFARIVADRATAFMVGMRRLHSGCVNDYIAWLVAGLAVIGGALALV